MLGFRILRILTEIRSSHGELWVNMLPLLKCLPRSLNFQCTINFSGNNLWVGPRCDSVAVLGSLRVSSVDSGRVTFDLQIHLIACGVVEKGSKRDHFVVCISVDDTRCCDLIRTHELLFKCRELCEIISLKVNFHCSISGWIRCCQLKVIQNTKIRNLLY